MKVLVRISCFRLHINAFKSTKLVYILKIVLDLQVQEYQSISHSWWSDLVATNMFFKQAKRE